MHWRNNHLLILLRNRSDSEIVAGALQDQAKLLTLVLALRLRRPELFAPLDRANS
jgi:hypothetical protein